MVLLLLLLLLGHAQSCIMPQWCIMLPITYRHTVLLHACQPC